MGLTIKLLGRPRIERNSALIELPGHRPLALLAYLLLNRKPLHRQHLIDVFFDGPDDPRAALRWTLSKLRIALGSQYILADREEISFNFQSDSWLDVAAFEAGQSELYQGDFLEGMYLRDAPRFEDWLAFERQRLRNRYETSLEQQLADARRQGDLAASLVTAQQLLKLDNLREDWHYALIDAYARLGKRTLALEQYDRLRQLLQKEWGLEPSPGTQALVEAIQAAYIQSSLPAPVTEPPVAISAFSPPLPIAATLDTPTVGQPTSPPADRTQPRRLRPAWIALATLGLVLAAIWAVSKFGLNSATSQAGDPPRTAINPTQVVLESAQSGKTVWILGPFYDDQARLFKQSMQAFEEKSGIQVEFLTGSRPYEPNLAQRIDSGDLPDIAIFPQPAWLNEYAGKVVDLYTFLDDEYLREQYPEQFLELATIDGRILGLWNTLHLKSLVWYPRQAFEEKGYQVPETWDELIALTAQIAADGGAPWCIGVDDLDASGWVGTDWVEDILLRIAPPATYDAWVRHELPFDSPEIRRAFEIMGEIWLNNDYVYGGTARILGDNFIDSQAHLLEDPPACYLHRQASFARFFVPPEAQFGQDYDFFYLPPIDPQYGKPVLGAGEIFAMFNDRPEVREVMRYLTTPESTEALIKAGGFLSAHKGTPLEWFPTEADLRFAQIVRAANTYRFDGSDLMPVPVGLGSFFQGIVKWVAGADLDQVLKEIDASWPAE